MKFFALFYYVVENFVERRAAYRAEHLRLAREACERDELIFGGAMNDPADSALLIFRAADRSVAEDFAHHQFLLKPSGGSPRIYSWGGAAVRIIKPF